MKSKYIIVSIRGCELPIVFNPIIEHGQVQIPEGKVVSAGFCSRNKFGVFDVWGGSISLKINVRPEDVGILNRHLERNC